MNDINCKFMSTYYYFSLCVCMCVCPWPRYITPYWRNMEKKRKTHTSEMSSLYCSCMFKNISIYFSVRNVPI